MPMSKSFQHITSYAWLVMLDGLRRHALLGLVLLALACQVGGLLFFSFIPRDIGRAATDFVFSIGWLTGLLFLFFHAVNASAWGEDRRVIHAILARPISRAEYVLGLFGGLAGLLLLLNLVLAVLGRGILAIIQNNVDAYYFQHLSSSYYLLSWLGLFLMQLIILSVILLFSGLVRGSFTVLLLSISYYFICNGLPVVRDSLLQQGGTEGSGFALLLKGMTAIFPDFERFNYKVYVVTDQLFPATGELLVNFGLLFAYVALALWAACAVYGKRDLK
jgi:ABC-type transport system involved in multi-copper enzyme maturation permease subunit